MIVKGITLPVSGGEDSTTDEPSIGIMQDSHVLKMGDRNAYNRLHQRLCPFLYIVAVLQTHDSLLKMC